MASETGERELVIHAFIVKIWLEESSEPGAASWTGHVTHVPSSERRHFLDLDTIREFISGYLVPPSATGDLGREVGNG